MTACDQTDSLPDQVTEKTTKKSTSATSAPTPSTATTTAPLFEKPSSQPPLDTNNKKDSLPPGQNSKNTAQPRSADKRKPSITELPVNNPVSLPLDRQLTDAGGRKLDVTITARYEKELAVIRKKDSKAFTLPIEKLSDTDMAFALKLPLSIKPAKTDPFITRREKMLTRYREDQIRLREKLASGTLNTSQMRGVVKDQKNLDLKIQDTKKQIQEHQQ